MEVPFKDFKKLHSSKADFLQKKILKTHVFLPSHSWIYYPIYLGHVIQSGINQLIPYLFLCNVLKGKLNSQEFFFRYLPNNSGN